SQPLPPSLSRSHQTPELHSISSFPSQSPSPPHLRRRDPPPRLAKPAAEHPRAAGCGARPSSGRRLERRRTSRRRELKEWGTDDCSSRATSCPCTAGGSRAELGWTLSSTLELHPARRTSGRPSQAGGARAEVEQAMVPPLAARHPLHRPSQAPPSCARSTQQGPLPLLRRSRPLHPGGQRGEPRYGR
ncbi:unnamed protein product, partial [Urochloa humidicola]